MAPLLAALAVAATASAAAPPAVAPAAVWGEPMMTKIFRESTPSRPTPSSPTPIVLRGGRAEQVVVQICVRPEEDVAGTSLRLSNMPFAKEVRLVAWVSAGSNTHGASGPLTLHPGNYPDPLPLPPPGGTPLARNSTSAFWLTIEIPATAVPGPVHFSAAVFDQAQHPVGAPVPLAIEVGSHSAQQRTLRTDSTVGGLDTRHWAGDSALHYPGMERVEVLRQWYHHLTHRVNEMALGLGANSH